MKWILGLSLVLWSGFLFADEFSKALQDISVTIKSGMADGSGTIFTREVKNKDGVVEKVNFVWTAGHVVADLRDVREIIDSTGNTRKVSQFKDAAIVKEINKDGRRVGELKMDVKVIKYSDAENNEDLALLKVIETDFIKANGEFYLDRSIPDVGEKLYHCGSLLGQTGANSMTEGIMSHQGRVYNGKIFDQTTVTAFPGSSGGGVFVKGKNNKPLYVGMVVLGSGETFNLIVPVRRMLEFCKKNKIEWAMDPKATVPSEEEMDKIPVEGMMKASSQERSAGAKPDDSPVPSIPKIPAKNSTESIKQLIKLDNDVKQTERIDKLISGGYEYK